jgi:hypothetical protein
MESEKIHNCGFCDNPNVSKKCGKSHTRCKETRFCNKTCETAAHSKERKSDVTTNEDPVDESLKNAIESEIKRKAKKERQTRLNIIRAMNRGGSGRIQNLPTFPIVVSQSPEDETQDQN